MSLPFSYFAVTYYPPTIQCQFAFVAIEPNTRVNVTLAARRQNVAERVAVLFKGRVYNNKDTLEVTLDQYEAIQVRPTRPFTEPWRGGYRSAGRSPLGHLTRPAFFLRPLYSRAVERSSLIDRHRVDSMARHLSARRGRRMQNKRLNCSGKNGHAEHGVRDSWQ